MALAGLSSLGVEFSFGTETTAGDKPTTFKTLTRVNSIGGLSISSEQIDASALEDYVSRYVAGRGDVDSEFTITINLTPDTQKEWEDVITAYDALTGGKQMWFQVAHPSMDDAFFVVAQPPKKIPLPEISQNELLTVEMSLTVSEYVGLDDKVTPTP